MKLEAPSDALPEQRHLLAYRPSFVVWFDTPAKSRGRYYLLWNLRNVGAGIARRVRVFLPGVMTDALDRPLEPNEQITRRTLFEDKHAFLGFMKPPVQLIVEFEDFAGNLYRQYGYVYQPAVEGGKFNGYAVEELDRPYLVADRIVQTEPTAEATNVLPKTTSSATSRGAKPTGTLSKPRSKANKSGENAGKNTFAAKVFRRLSEPTSLRKQTFDLVTAVRKCLIKYHGDLDVDAFVAPEISQAFAKRMLAIKNKIERFSARRILRERSRFPVTVTRLAMFLDDIEEAASHLDKEIPPVLSP